VQQQDLSKQLEVVLKQATKDSYQVTVQLEEQRSTSTEVERLREVLTQTENSFVTYHLSVG